MKSSFFLELYKMQGIAACRPFSQLCSQMQSWSKKQADSENTCLTFRHFCFKVLAPHCSKTLKKLTWSLFKVITTLSLKKWVALKRAFGFAETVANYLELVYLVTALVPSDTACLASSPGSRRRTAVWISRDVMVERLL